VLLWAPIRYGLAVAAISAGLLLGIAAARDIAEEGPDDLGRWLGSRPGRVGLVILVPVVAGATGVSILRFPLRPRPLNEGRPAP
jgi:hypothetical protein